MRKEVASKRLEPNASGRRAKHRCGTRGCTNAHTHHSVMIICPFRLDRAGSVSTAARLFTSIYASQNPLSYYVIK